MNKYTKLFYLFIVMVFLIGCKSPEKNGVKSKNNIEITVTAVVRPKPIASSLSARGSAIQATPIPTKKGVRIGLNTLSSTRTITRIARHSQACDGAISSTVTDYNIQQNHQDPFLLSSFYKFLSNNLYSFAAFINGFLLVNSYI